MYGEQHGFPKDQIPVQVDGKTYFGCCEMCKGRLAQDASARNATDPVSGKPVDKATAVIGATSDGKVLYFESEQTFSQFAERT
jgi:YHS domain-containing protein